MTDTAALYGFEFTKPFTAGGMTFSPVERQQTAANELARNLNELKMTGTVSADELPSKRVFQLEGVLSFIEHLEVLVSKPISGSLAKEKPHEHFQARITTPARHQGGGAMLGPDALNPWRDSRQTFIDLAFTRLADAEYCKSSRFDSLLFKTVETFRQRRPFLEISYFLLMSGLEAFCRAEQSDYKSKNAAVPITLALKKFGFNVHQDNPKDLPRSISTFLHIRNALFHQGDFTATVLMDKSKVTLPCSDYFFGLQMLVSLTVMKAVGFDDGHTNWDCWIDRQLRW